MNRIRLLFSAAFLTVVNLSFAQEFAPIGAEWHYTEGFAFSGDINYLTIKSIKDTTINGKQSRRLDCKRLCWNPSGRQYIHYTNDSLYYYYPVLDTFQLIAAFNAQPDDSWNILIKDWDESVDTVTVRVDSINSIAINEKPLRQLFVTYYLKNHDPNGAVIQNYDYNSRIIEKIGDVHYLFNFPVNAGLMCDDNYSEGLRCYEDAELGLYSTGIADSCTYTYTWTGIESSTVLKKITVFPNPTNGLLVINGSTGKEITAQIKDLTGNTIFSKNLNANNTIDLTGLPKGLYILGLYIHDKAIGFAKLLKN